MDWIRTTVGEGGRIVIPAEFRKALGLKAGDVVMLGLADDELRLVSLRDAIRRTQEMVRRSNPEGRSLVDELIAERRREAALE